MWTLLALAALVSAAPRLEILYPRNDSIIDVERIELSVWAPKAVVDQIASQEEVTLCVRMDDKVRALDSVCMS